MGYFNISVSSKNLQLVSIVIDYTPAPTCTESNLAFAQPVINKLAADAAFTQAATSLNGTTAIAYTSSNTGVATVNETTGEVTIAGAGSTIITASQAAGTHNAVDYCAAITTYTVNVASAAPTITVTEITVPDMVAYVGAYRGFLEQKLLPIITPKENLLECEVLDSSILGGKQKTLREYAEDNLKLKKFREQNFGNNGFSKADHPRRVYDEFIKEDFIPEDK
jgi:hypothetical protein